MKVDPRWTAVDQFITDSLIAPDAALDAALRDSIAGGLPSINVTPAQGRFLQILAQSMGARRILEVGTLGGYSAIWLARALPPSGQLVTLEIDPATAAIARVNLARARLDKIVDVRIGPALATLKTLAAEAREPFDLVFIDADKQNNPEYFQRALDLTHSGSLIVVDNAVRGGAIIDADSRDPDVQGTRRVYQVMSAEKRVIATAIQTVGSKGYDGFAIARVL
ncbi:MAG TPA: O-methyltransferase [Polyangia bacterium]|nr:O-methyltransferase [Polyangia bacterium]